MNRRLHDGGGVMSKTLDHFDTAAFRTSVTNSSVQRPRHNYSRTTQGFYTQSLQKQYSAEDRYGQSKPGSANNPLYQKLMKKLEDQLSTTENVQEVITPTVVQHYVPLFKESWVENNKPYLLKDHEPLVVTAKKYHMIRCNVYSRMKNLPLSIRCTQEGKSFIEIYLGMNSPPSRNDYILKTSDNKLVLGRSYANKLYSDTSIKLALYFYGFETITLRAEFYFTSNPIVNNPLLNWTSHLKNYDEFLKIQLHRPKDRRSQEVKELEAEKKLKKSHRNARSPKSPTLEHLKIFDDTPTSATAKHEHPDKKKFRFQARSSEPVAKKVESEGNIARRVNHINLVKKANSPPKTESKYEELSGKLDLMRTSAINSPNKVQFSGAANQNIQSAKNQNDSEPKLLFFKKCSTKLKTSENREDPKPQKPYSRATSPEPIIAHLRTLPLAVVNKLHDPQSFSQAVAPFSRSRKRRVKTKADTASIIQGRTQSTGFKLHSDEESGGTPSSERRRLEQKKILADRETERLDKYAVTKSKAERIIHERIKELDRRIDDAASRRSSIAVKKKTTLKSTIEAKLEKIERKNRQVRRSMELMILDPVSRVWITTFYFYEVIGNFSNRIIDAKHRSKCLTQFCSLSRFIGKLRRRTAIRKEHVYEELITSIKTAVTLLTKLRDNGINRRVRMIGMKFMGELHRVYNLRAIIYSCSIRLEDIKMKFIRHMQRKNTLKDKYLKELNRFSAHMNDSKISGLESFKDYTEEYAIPVFEVIFNVKLNEILANKIPKLLQNRIKSPTRRIRRNFDPDLQYKEILESNKIFKFYESINYRRKGYGVYQTLQMNMELRRGYYEGLCQDIMRAAEMKEQAGSKRATKQKTRLQQMVENPVELFTKISVLFKELTLGLEPWMYVCILLSMQEFKEIRQPEIEKAGAEQTVTVGETEEELE